ncbi:MAG: Activator of Hsp90 ATPase 1 family protein [Candidatus Eremiobacteraeota bacterium]|nr:Activator of Hsp90 ATPase 1 family protein [Candidatus Eremiobacteraeota bacterium]
MTHSGIAPSPAVPGTANADYESTVFLKGPTDRVFDALTTTSGLAGWWSTVSGSGVQGGELTFAFDDDRLVVHVDEAQRPSAVRWTPRSSFEPVSDWVGTTIAFDISPSGDGGSRLRLRHIGLTPQLECFELCRRGWDYYLQSLVEYVDSGQGRPFGSTIE